jgi:hypothetical protein
MNFQLTEQQQRMVAAVRELAQGEFKANGEDIWMVRFLGKT